MGLLDNLRKKAASPDQEIAPTEQVDVVDELSDDAWLSGIERRNQTVAPIADAPVADAPVADVPVAPAVETSEAGIKPETPAPAEHVQFLTDAAHDQMVNEVPAAMSPPPPPAAFAPEQDESDSAGMVFAGLEPDGVTEFPSVAVSDATTADPAPAPPAAAPLTAFPSIERGPIGPDAVPHLQTLGLTVGCTWAEAAQARRDLMGSLSESGSADELQFRVEINYAYATLRLLRVGPLKG